MSPLRLLLCSCFVAAATAQAAEGTANLTPQLPAPVTASFSETHLITSTQGGGPREVVRYARGVKVSFEVAPDRVVAMVVFEATAAEAEPSDSPGAGWRSQVEALANLPHRAGLLELHVDTADRRVVLHNAEQAVARASAHIKPDEHLTLTSVEEELLDFALGAGPLHDARGWLASHLLLEAQRYVAAYLIAAPLVGEVTATAEAEIPGRPAHVKVTSGLVDGGKDLVHVYKKEVSLPARATNYEGRFSYLLDPENLSLTYGSLRWRWSGTPMGSVFRSVKIMREQ